MRPGEPRCGAAAVAPDVMQATQRATFEGGKPPVDGHAVCKHYHHQEGGGRTKESEDPADAIGCISIIGDDD